jgi:hypothetical protein
MPTPTALPESPTHGYVTGRYLLVGGTTTREVDRLPERKAASGTIRFRPAVPSIYTAGEVILAQEVHAQLDRDGFVVDATGTPGVWLLAGAYDVTFELKGATEHTLPPMRIFVNASHTEETPLDLGAEMPREPAPNEVFVVNWDVYHGALAARSDAFGFAADAGVSASAAAASADNAAASAAGMVVSGSVVGDDLKLTRRDGSTVTAGSVRGPRGYAGEQLPVTSLGNVSKLDLSGAAYTAPRVVNATLTANATLTLPASPGALSYVLVLNLRQDATGGRTITVPSSMLLPGGLPQPFLTPTPGALDQLILEWTGTDWLCKLGGMALA